MTTKSDWELRVDVLRREAEQLRSLAQEFYLCADEIERAGLVARKNIVEMQTTAKPE